MLSRIVALILVLVILIGGGILIYRFFKGPAPTTSKTLTINKDGKFDSTNFKLNNDEVFVIKNNDDVSHTVKKVSDDSTVVELSAGQTSRELKLNNDSKVQLYLASNKSVTSTVVVGSPQTQTTKPVAQKPASTPVTVQKNQSLPNTGPEDNFLFFALAFVGFCLVKISNLYWKWRIAR